MFAGYRAYALCVPIIGFLEHEKFAAAREYIEIKAEVFPISTSLVIGNSVFPYVRSSSERLQQTEVDSIDLIRLATCAITIQIESQSRPQQVGIYSVLDDPPLVLVIHRKVVGN